MSQEWRLNIRPNGNAVEIALTGGPQLAGQTFPRGLPQIPPAGLDSFRGGDAPAAEIELLTEQVSDWFLGADLRQKVTDWFFANPNDQLRFVFVVDDALYPFADLPFELARTAPNDNNLIVHPRIAGFVHLLSKVGAKTAPAAPYPWPMRVLLVRSNPGDIGGGRVPLGAPIRQRILDLGVTHFGKGTVEVDLYSSDEPEAKGRPVWSAFQEAVKNEYDILLYLGHGDVLQLQPNMPPASQLQFESENDPSTHEPVPSKQLASLLHQYPVPVVVLAGCLTANAGAPTPPGIPAWMRGNQGMAQALINSECGVLFAIGMRCKVDADDAETFLHEFFESLFKRHPGDVELAIRAGRQKLFQKHTHPPHWAAPMAFSALVAEPVFGFLGRPPTFDMTPEINRELDARGQIIWPMLASLAPANRPPAFVPIVTMNRANLHAELMKQGGMLIPELVDAQPGTRVSMPLTMEGLTFTKLKVKLSGGGLSLAGVRPTQLLKNAGYQLLADPMDPGFFQIQQAAGAAPAPRPGGVVAEVDLDVPADALGVFPVSVEVLDSDSPGRIWAGRNAVIVTAA